MDEAVLIFPHQLFEFHPALEKKRKIILVEDPLFFGDKKYPIKYHKKKLILHRASMQSYYQFLLRNKYDVKYIPYASLNEIERINVYKKLFRDFTQKHFHYVDTVDFILEIRLKEASVESGVKLTKHSSPGFLNNEHELAEYFKDKKKYLMASFYIKQRKRLGILVENNKPIGGKWSYDKNNRKKIPKGLEIPYLNFPYKSKFIDEAVKYVEKKFTNNFGSTENFSYPINHTQAEAWLDDFLENRLINFGEYEDAILKEESYLFHSVLTPMLNIGLLTPKQVIDKTLSFADIENVPINSLEGFIRQIIGWREYIRAVYISDGVKERTTNYFRFNRKLPRAFYDASTGIEPVDVVINRLLKNAYTHHIERLMILGNFMLLCEIHPDEVYKWFMEMYIDAYDWVMVPNVYGMSQYADGGLICTKPYISSSNYVRKMSDFTSGSWCEVWDGLFWRFIFKHQKVFAQNPRMSVLLIQLNKMSKNRFDHYIETAENFLRKL